MKLDPYFRKDNHNLMTFAMSYAYSENYILVLSHDEVVHLKCSMLNKMPGLGFDKYANLKVGYAFMIGHVGKKLLFMGQEFAQLREWSEERELDWFLLAEKEHQAVQNWFRDLLHLYKKNKALYEMDDSWEGFEWINADDRYRSVFSFMRHSKDNKKNLLFICNFTPMEWQITGLAYPEESSISWYWTVTRNSMAETDGRSSRSTRPLSRSVTEDLLLCLPVVTLWRGNL